MHDGVCGRRVLGSHASGTVGVSASLLSGRVMRGNTTPAFSIFPKKSEPATALEIGRILDSVSIHVFFFLMEDFYMLRFSLRL